jgi:hypothetical protein
VQLTGGQLLLQVALLPSCCCLHLRQVLSQESLLQSLLLICIPVSMLLLLLLCMLCLLITLLLRLAAGQVLRGSRAHAF